MDDVNNSKSTKIIFATDARKQLFEGLNTAAEAVSCTLGPKGRTVLIQKDGSAPIVTKDGVTVSKSIRFEDPIKRMGAELLREAASHTNDIAGDGTTTASVLTQALVAEGLKLIDAGYAAKDICGGINAAVDAVTDNLRSSAVEIKTSDKIAQIGTISANGDRSIGELIAEAMMKVTADGIITVDEAKGMHTSLEIVDGMQFDRGYVSPFFVTNNEKMHALYKDCFVLVTDKKLTHMKDLIKLLEQVLSSQKPLLIIADDVEGEALQALVINRVKGNLPIVAVKAPGYGEHRLELLNDICKLTGAQLISSSRGLSLDGARLTDLGNAVKIVVDSKSTTIVASQKTKDDVDSHVSELKLRLQDVTLAQEDVVKLRMRIAKLSSGVAIVKVGGSTEIEMIERKYRIEDALNATKAAVEEGIVPGGGVALLNAVKCVNPIIERKPTPGYNLGIDAVMKACLAPLRRISKNAGKSEDVIVEKLMGHQEASTYGYNASTDEYVDMIDAGVVDPVKVTRIALKHAASVATTFLTLDAVIYEQ
jgi:chaperonin GroEL